MANNTHMQFLHHVHHSGVLAHELPPTTCKMLIICLCSHSASRMHRMSHDECENTKIVKSVNVAFQNTQQRWNRVKTREERCNWNALIILNCMRNTNYRVWTWWDNKNPCWNPWKSVWFPSTSNAPFLTSFDSISMLLGVLKSYVDGLYEFCVFAFIISHAVHAACWLRA